MRKGSKAKPGTYQVGSQRYNSKLREDQIPEIKRLTEQGKSRQWIAMKFGVHKSIIHRIVAGTGWTHV